MSSFEMPEATQEMPDPISPTISSDPESEIKSGKEEKKLSRSKASAKKKKRAASRTERASIRKKQRLPAVLRVAPTITVENKLEPNIFPTYNPYYSPPFFMPALRHPLSSWDRYRKGEVKEEEIDNIVIYFMKHFEQREEFVSRMCNRDYLPPDQQAMLVRGLRNDTQFMRVLFRDVYYYARGLTYRKKED